MLFFFNRREGGIRSSVSIKDEGGVPSAVASVWHKYEHPDDADDGDALRILLPHHRELMRDPVVTQMGHADGAPSSSGFKASAPLRSLGPSFGVVGYRHVLRSQLLPTRSTAAASERRFDAVHPLHSGGRGHRKRPRRRANHTWARTADLAHARARPRTQPNHVLWNTIEEHIEQRRWERDRFRVAGSSCADRGHGAPCQAGRQALGARLLSVSRCTWPAQLPRRR